MQLVMTFYRCRLHISSWSNKKGFDSICCPARNRTVKKAVCLIAMLRVSSLWGSMKHPSKIIIALIFLFTTFWWCNCSAGAVGPESALQKKRDMIKKFLQVSPSSGEMMHWPALFEVHGCVWIFWLNPTPLTVLLMLRWKKISDFDQAGITWLLPFKGV